MSALVEKNDTINKYVPLWGEWKIEGLIGVGSFGTVYKVSKALGNEKLFSAVKLISIPNKEQLSEARVTLDNNIETLKTYLKGVVNEIENEIKLLYELRGNTNVISYEDYSIKENTETIGWDILIRMEFVSSLTSYIETHAMTIEDVLKLGSDICKALELCNKKGIIHRDIKDDNIFISNNGDFKLGDFGIARELTRSGGAYSQKGTPYYMAPEIYVGKKYDFRADIYSLGIVMYRLLNNGRFPFMPPFPEEIKYGDGQNALDMRLSGNDVPKAQNAPDAVWNIVKKACFYNPENRYGTIEEMRLEIENTLNNLAIGIKKAVILSPKGNFSLGQTNDIETKNTNIVETQYISMEKSSNQKKSVSFVTSTPNKGTENNSLFESIVTPTPKQKSNENASGIFKNDAKLTNRKIIIIGSIVGFIALVLIILFLVIPRNDKVDNTLNEKKSNQSENTIKDSNSNGSIAQNGKVNQIVSPTNKPTDKPKEPTVTKNAEVSIIEFTDKAPQYTLVDGKVELKVLRIDNSGINSVITVLVNNNYKDDVSFFGNPNIVSQGKTINADPYDNMSVTAAAVAPGSESEFKFTFNKKDTSNVFDLVGKMHTMGYFGNLQFKITINPNQ